MKLTPFLPALALTLTACATPNATPPALPTLGGPAKRVVDLPGPAGPGEPQTARKLVDEPALKLATIVLRGGTIMAEHTTPVPATIVALQGSGHVVAGGERLRVDATHAVVLAPNVPHSVEPDSGTDLVLMVHHLGSAPHDPHHHHH